VAGEADQAAPDMTTTRGGTLLIGTSNPSKVARWAAALPNHRVVAPWDIAATLDVDESAGNVLDNAVRKARAYAARSGLVTLSEDAGLRVHALGGTPGVKLRTWGGTVTGRLSDEELAATLRSLLAGVKDTSATFDIAVAVAAPDGFVRTAQRASEGWFDLERLDPAAEEGNPLASAFISSETGAAWTEMVDLKDRPESSRRFVATIESLVSEVVSHEVKASGSKR